MKRLFAAIIAAVFISGCQTAPKKHTAVPAIDTITIKKDLSKMQASIDTANRKIEEAKRNLTQMDSKAVKIQEALRKW